MYFQSLWEARGTFGRFDVIFNSFSINSEPFWDHLETPGVSFFGAFFGDTSSVVFFGSRVHKKQKKSAENNAPVHRFRGSPG